jgi:NAD-dependent SIR2 family protein deacetylase
MLGAGASVSAGIPDFRSPGTGLYDNLQKYDLPRAEAIFDIEYFRKSPDAFYQLCKDLWPGIFKPTPTHHFLRLLHEKGRLSRCMTQNIDSLESLAGLPKSSIVAAHGNFDGATCITTGERVDPDEVREAVFGENENGTGWKALAEKHGGLVKPDIVFFGESMPPRFFASATTDLPACDLLLVVGTSLQVFPFAGTSTTPLPHLHHTFTTTAPPLLLHHYFSSTTAPPLLLRHYCSTTTAPPLLLHHYPCHLHSSSISFSVSSSISCSVSSSLRLPSISLYSLYTHSILTLYSLYTPFILPLYSLYTHSSDPGLVHEVPSTTPRVLINRERAGEDGRTNGANGELCWARLR